MKKLVSVLCVFLAAVLLLSTAGVSAYAREETLASSYMSFNENGKFRIMQITDTHYTDQPYKESVDFIGCVLDDYQPDLVVFTGDNLTGGWFMSTPYSVRNAIDALVAPVSERNIPFAVVFGNHDWQTTTAKSEQLSYYMAHSSCVAVPGMRSLHRIGNYNILLKNSAGTKDIFNLWFVDSGTRRADDLYSCVDERQIEWYEQTSDALKASNGGEVIPSILFQHIPVPEIYQLYTEVPEGTEGAIAGDGKYYLLNTQIASGDFLSTSGIPDLNKGQYESWVNKGDVLAAFFGHDHVNDYVGTTADGITLGMTKSAGFQSRGDGAKRGVRIIDLDENDVESFSTYSVYWSEYFGEDYPEEKKEYDFAARLKSILFDILSYVPALYLHIIFKL